MKFIYDLENNSSSVESSFFQSNHILYGQYINLKKGKYTAIFNISGKHKLYTILLSLLVKDKKCCSVDISSDCGENIIASKDVKFYELNDKINIDFELTEYTKEIEFRCACINYFPIKCNAVISCSINIDDCIIDEKFNYKRQFFIETIPTCNMNCKFCTYQTRKNIKTCVNTDSFKLLLDDISAKNLNKNTFVSFEVLGEPLLNKNIFDIVSHAKCSDMYTSFISNGLLLNEEVANKIYEHGLDQINISLHTPLVDKNKFKELRGIDIAFEDYFKNICSFLRGLVKKSAHNSVYIYIASNEGIKNIPGLGKYCNWDWFNDYSELKIKLSELFKIFENIGETLNNEFPEKRSKALTHISNANKILIDQNRIATKIDDVDYDAFFQNSDKSYFQGYMFYPNMFLQFKSFGLVTQNVKFIKKAFNFSDKLHVIIEEAEEDFKCNDLILDGAVLSNGEVALCCGDSDNEYKIGNINKNSIFDIYCSDTYRKVANNPYVSAVCRRCKGNVIILDENNCNIVISGDIHKSDDGRKFICGIIKCYAIFNNKLNTLMLNIKAHQITAANILIKILKSDKRTEEDIIFYECFSHRISILNGDVCSKIYYEFSDKFIYKIEIIPLLSNMPMTKHSLEFEKIYFE